MKKTIMGLALIGVLTLTGCSSSSDSESTTSEPKETIKEEVKQEEFVVGDELEYAGIIYKVEGLIDLDPGVFTELAEGERVVGIELSITNTTSENYTFSSLLFLDVLNVDGYECRQELATSTNKKPVDGDVPPGVTKRGVNAFVTDCDLQAIMIQPEIGVAPAVVQLN